MKVDEINYKKLEEDIPKIAEALKMLNRFKYSGVNLKKLRLSKSSQLLAKIMQQNSDLEIVGDYLRKKDSMTVEELGEEIRRKMRLVFDYEKKISLIELKRDDLQKDIERLQNEKKENE